VFCLLGWSVCALAVGEFERWTKTGPFAPGGGNGQALAIDPQDPATVYLSTSGGVFKTVNGGRDWVPAGRGLEGNAFRLAVDPHSRSTVYAALYQLGVFRTVDGGASWRPINGGLGSLGGIAARALAVDPSTPRTVYVGISPRGVFKSSDAGESWVQILGSNGEAAASLGIMEIVVDPADPATLYAATSKGIYKTVDGGLRWTSRNEGLDLVDDAYGGAEVLALALDGQSSRTLYASTPNGLFKTSNGGESWNRSGAGLPAGFHPIAIAAHGTSVYASVYNQGVFRSVDAGSSWFPAHAILGSYVSDLEIDPRQPATVYSTEGGITKTTDGGATWRRLDGSFRSVRTLKVLFDPAVPTRAYAVTDGGVFRSEDSGDRWTLTDFFLPHGEIRGLWIDPRDSSKLYASSSLTPRLFRSRDGGATWARADVGLPENQGFYPLTMVPTSTLYVGVGYAGIWRSSNEGETWTFVGLSGTFISALTAHPLNPLVLYAGTSEGDIHRTSDGGDSWTMLYRQRSRGVSSIAIDPLDPRFLYVGWGYSGIAPGGFVPPGGVLRSTDGGTTWLALEGGPTLTVGPVVLDPRRPQRIYAGGLSGFFRSDDRGQTWASLSSGLPQSSYFSGIAFDPQSPSRILAAVGHHEDLGGVYELTLEPDRETPVRPCAIDGCPNRRGARAIPERPTRP
jgi:photosystem II stability/assembly factor-like uncharacterized protein